MAQIYLKQGPRCQEHPHRETLRRCDRCGLPFCEECLLPAGRKADGTRDWLCARCTTALRIAAVRAASARRWRSRLARLTALGQIVGVSLAGVLLLGAIMTFGAQFLPRSAASAPSPALEARCSELSRIRSIGAIGTQAGEDAVNVLTYPQRAAVTLLTSSEVGEAGSVAASTAPEVPAFQAGPVALNRHIARFPDTPAAERRLFSCPNFWKIKLDWGRNRKALSSDFRSSPVSFLPICCPPDSRTVGTRERRMAMKTTRRSGRRQVVSVSKLSIRDAIALHSDHNQAEGKSADTDRWYRERLGVFATWMEQRKTPTIADITAPVAEEFAVSLRRKTTQFQNHPFRPAHKAGLSSHTVNNYIRALRAFTNWLATAGYLAENPLAKLKPPRMHKAVVDTLTDEEITKLLASIDRSTALGLRDYALIVTFLDTGARCSELLELRLEDVHLEDDWLLLDGKGNKERMVRLGATAKAALRLWLRQGRPAMAHEACPYVVVDARSGRQLSTNGFEQRIRAIAKTALPGRRIYCHLFRHTFATNYLVYGLGDELHLMATLGHTTLAMTRQYVEKAKFLKALKDRQGSVMDTLASGRPRGRPRTTGVTLWSAHRTG